MQEHEKVSKTNIRRWVRGWQVRWVPCEKCGKTKNAVELRLGYGRGVPVEDCIATTGSMPGKGCDAMGVEGRGYCVWGAVKEGEGSKVTVDGKYFGKEVGGVDEAGKEYKAEEMLACPLFKPV